MSLIIFYVIIILHFPPANFTQTYYLISSFSFFLSVFALHQVIPLLLPLLIASIVLLLLWGWLEMLYLSVLFPLLLLWVCPFMFLSVGLPRWVWKLCVWHLVVYVDRFLQIFVCFHAYSLGFAGFKFFSSHPLFVPCRLVSSLVETLGHFWWWSWCCCRRWGP